MTANNDQNLAETTEAPKKPARARDISDERKAECIKVLVERLAPLPAGSSINVNDLSDEFECASNITHAIIREAVNEVRRFFEIDEDKTNSSATQVPTLTDKSLPIGRTHFNKANKGREERDKFNTEDKFEIEFSEEDLDVFTVTRIHRAAASSATEEVQNG